MALHPAVAEVRHYVRNALADVPTGSAVLVACSGGADSLALVAGAVFEGHKKGLRIYGATVDHGLQEGSAEQARRVIDQMAALGVDETYGVSIEVRDDAGIGPEAAARQARYEVLGQMAERFGIAVVLLGHTRDDQAETVLLGLTRGSGGRSIAGMRRAYVAGGVSYRRPLLDVSRLATETACLTEGIEFWSDPHNDDPAYTRVRVRRRVMPVLENELGPGITSALARTADPLRDDMELLDDMAEQAHRHLVERGSEGGLDADLLRTLPAPIRSRVLRLLALGAGSPPSELAREHILAMEALVTRWRGQQWIDLPGHLRAVRRDGHVHVDAAPPNPDS